MGCSLCVNQVCDASDPNLIIDVEKALTDFAWEMFEMSHGKLERKFLKRKRYKIDVPMNYYHFREVHMDVTDGMPREAGATGLGPSCDKSLLAGKGLANSDRTSPGSFGLETEFNNDTDEKQTYTFQFEKVRTATVEVSYQRGFSIGAKANFSIGLPKVLGDGSIGVEMDKRLEITKATGEKFEESLKTSATSDIVVSARSRYIAKVVMEEKAFLANFTVVVEMSMPAGKAPIYITDTKTGDIVAITTVCDLYDIFCNFSDGAEEVKDKEGKVRTDAVRFTVKGIVDGVQLSTHKINLYTSSSLSAAEVEKKAAGRGSEKLSIVDESSELIRLDD